MKNKISLKFVSPNNNNFSHYVRFLSVLIKLHQEFAECLEIESPLVADVADHGEADSAGQFSETASAEEASSSGLGSRLLPWVRKYVPADRSRQNPLTRRFNSWLDKFEPETDHFDGITDSENLSGLQAIIHLQYEMELNCAPLDFEKLRSLNNRQTRNPWAHFSEPSENLEKEPPQPAEITDDSESAESNTLGELFEEAEDDHLSEGDESPADLSSEAPEIPLQDDNSEKRVVLLLDDRIISGETHSAHYREKWKSLIDRLDKTDHSLQNLESLHLLFMGKMLPENRRAQLSQIPMFDPEHPYRFHRHLRDTGLQALREFDPTLYDLLREKIALTRISCSFIYTGNVYPETGPEIFAAAFGHIFTYGASLSDASSFYSSLLDGIKLSTLKTDYYADLQITILGQEKKHAIFQAVSRNLCERWPVRHQVFSTENIPMTLEKDEASGLIKIDREGMPDKPTYIHIAEVSDQHSNHNLNHFNIGSYRIHSQRDMIIWIVPGDWFDPVYDKNVVQSPINHELIIIGQLVEALCEIKDADPPILHIFETTEIKTDYNIRPWPLFTPENDPIAAESVNRRVPRIYHLITSTIADARFHLIPWSYNGSHLDFAPGWIDRMVWDGLNWNPDIIGEANWNNRV